MGSYPVNRFVPGTRKEECAVCGFDFLKSELTQRWDGLWVCKEDFEALTERDKKALNIKSGS